MTPCSGCERIRKVVEGRRLAIPAAPLIHGRECHWHVHLHDTPEDVSACVSAWRYFKPDGTNGWATSAFVQGPRRSGATPPRPEDAKLLEVAEEIRARLQLELEESP